MKTLKKTTITLLLLTFVSASSHAITGKKTPPAAFNIEYVQLYIMDIFK